MGIFPSVKAVKMDECQLQLTLPPHCDGKGKAASDGESTGSSESMYISAVSSSECP